MAAEPWEICVKSSGNVFGYACGECKIMHAATIYACRWEEALAAAREAAVRCCNKHCEKCNAPIDKKTFYTHCTGCRGMLDAEREAKRFEEAEKVSYNDYEGWLYLDGVGHNEGYFETLEELLDWFFDEGREPPEWAWACEADEFKLSAERILEDALEDHHDGAYDRISNLDGMRLQRYLDIWAKKQHIVSYYYTHKKVVLIPEDVVKKYVEERGEPFVREEQAHVPSPVG